MTYKAPKRPQTYIEHKQIYGKSLNIV